MAKQRQKAAQAEATPVRNPLPQGTPVISIQEWRSDQIWPGCKKKRIKLPEWVKGVAVGEVGDGDAQKPWLVRWTWVEKRKGRTGVVKDVRREIEVCHLAHLLGTVFRAWRPEDDQPRPSTLFPEST